jgi:hypothetical protein
VFFGKGFQRIGGSFGIRINIGLTGIGLKEKLTDTGFSLAFLRIG